MEGLRIVVDCAHGAAYKSTPCVLRELGAELVVTGNQPTGRNINENFGNLLLLAVCAWFASRAGAEKAEG